MFRVWYARFGADGFAGFKVLPAVATVLRNRPSCTRTPQPTLNPLVLAFGPRPSLQVDREALDEEARAVGRNFTLCCAALLDP